MKAQKVNGVSVRTRKSAVTEQALQAASALLGFQPAMKVEVAAAMMGLETPTLYGWIERGQFPGFKVGAKSVRVRPEDVKAFLERSYHQAGIKAA